MEWEAWKEKGKKKKEKIKTRRSGGERERCTISFMSDPLKFHSTIERSNLRPIPVRLSLLRSKPVVSNLFPLLRSCFELERRLIFEFFFASEENEKKLKKERGKEKVSETFRWNVRRGVKSVMLDFSFLESWLGIRAKISRQKWLNIVQRAPCLVTKQPVADNATIF